MKKLLVFLLCMLVVVCMFGAVSANAEESSEGALVTFEGYQARTVSYNGIRAVYTLNKTVLEDLEESYSSVKIGMLLSSKVEEADYETGMIIGADRVTGITFYQTNAENGGFGENKYYEKEDGNIGFVYTITYKDGLATKQNFEKDVCFRAYVSLTDANGEESVSYIDSESSIFGYAISLSEIASYFTDREATNYPMLQRVNALVAGETPVDPISILGHSLDRYSIVVDGDSEADTKAGNAYDIVAARALSDALKNSVGYGLPICIDRPLREASYIEIKTNEKYENKYSYEISSDGAKITISANNVTAAAEGASALAKALGSTTYGENDSIKLSGKIYEYDYDSLYVPGALYQIDFFDSKASFGKFVGGTFGNSSYYNYVSTGFIVASTNTYFDDFIIGTPAGKAYGGTMQIVAPWTTPTSWTKTFETWEKSQTQYTYAESSVNAFHSKWQDKYLELGYNTTFNLSNVLSSAVAKITTDANGNVTGITGNGDFTIQLVSSLFHVYSYYDGDGKLTEKFANFQTNNMQLGIVKVKPGANNRYTPDANMNFGSVEWLVKASTDKPKVSPNVFIENRANKTVNEYLVAISGYYYPATTKTTINQDTAASIKAVDSKAKTSLSLGVNAADYFVSTDANKTPTVGGYDSVTIDTPVIAAGASIKFGNWMNTHLYALRVYGRVLNDAEVIQNHFADVAKYYKLDLTDYDKVSETAKLNVYKSVASIMINAKSDASYDQTKKNAQDAVSDAIEDAINTKYTVSYTANGQSGSISVNEGESFELPVVAKSGYTFDGYYIGDVQVTDANGKKLDTYTLASDISVEAKYTKDVVKYTVSYTANRQSGSISVNEGESFTLKVFEKDDYTFDGYYIGDLQVTDASGKKLDTYTLASDISVVAKYTRQASDADKNGKLIGNPLKDYYNNTTSFFHKMSRNPWDMALYDGKLYIGGGTYDGGWNSAPPMNVYDTETNTWDYVDFQVKMYAAFDPDSTTKKWYTLEATQSNSDNVSNQSLGVIPVTTDCEIANFRWIGGKLALLGGDSINGNTWADGTVSTKKPSEVNAEDTQKYVANNLGNYYIMETDENGKDVWVEYRNHVLHAAHVYDVVEVDHNGTNTSMFAVGTSGVQMPVKILTNKDTATYATAKFYLKNGTSYDGVNNNNRVYNFFKTDEGIFAFYSHQGGKAKKIFKYNVVNGEHRFEEVRDFAFGSTDTRLYTQSDVNKSGSATSERRLWTDFMRTETYKGYAYYTTGYLYKTKTFESGAATAITAPNSEIISDLMVRDGVLYALGFKKTNSSTNAYTNYIWSIDANDNFKEIRSFTSTGAYALSFEKDSEFFYVGLGGPTTHITDTVANVGNIIKLAINPIS